MRARPGGWRRVEIATTPAPPPTVGMHVPLALLAPPGHLVVLVACGLSLEVHRSATGLVTAFWRGSDRRVQRATVGQA